MQKKDQDVENTVNRQQRSLKCHKTHLLIKTQ